MLTLLWQRTCGYMCFILLSLYVSYVHVRRRLCLYVFSYMTFAVGLCPYILALFYICLCTIFVHVYAVYACICLRTSIHLMVLRTRIFCPSMFCLSLCMSVCLSVCLSVFVVVFLLLSLLLLLSMLPPRAPARTSQWPPPRYHIKTLGTKP